MGTWHLAHGHLAHGHLGTWANKINGNAHHNGIGEISCSMCLIVASERKFILKRREHFFAGHIPSAICTQALELIN
jgi:hypothetical protein